MNMPISGLATISPIFVQLVSFRYWNSIFTWCPCFAASWVMACIIPLWLVPYSLVVCECCASSVSGFWC